MNKKTQVPDKGFIKFSVCSLGRLRNSLLEDISNEHFAMLLGRTERIGNIEVVNILDSIFFDRADLSDQSEAFIAIRKERIAEILLDISQRIDLDTIIDVHTHPFSQRKAFFSGTDNADEKAFTKYLKEEFPDISYGSIVFSREQYSARLWSLDDHGYPVSCPALLMTPTPSDEISRSQAFGEEKGNGGCSLEREDSQFNRSVLALGLDAMRKITASRSLTIVGVGGLGSIVAENLIHSGFKNLHLIDHDTLSVSNMNRIVGATMQDAKTKRLKVDCLKEHLEGINPEAEISVHAIDVHNPSLEILFATSDWVFVCTDNQSSRLHVQNLCQKYSTPFISSGVNISVRERKVTDISGEVITVRPGDNLCLTCLGRLDPSTIASEAHFDPQVREQLVTRGYVEGADIKEPAVKTLNSMLANISVDVLINQFTERQEHRAIWVYENNTGPCIYPDVESVMERVKGCFCNRENT